MKKKLTITKKNRSPDLKNFIDQYLLEVTECLASLDKAKIGRAIEILITAYNKGRKIFIVGNGGSASTASHMACDLGKGTIQRIDDAKEKRFQVISLTDNVALMTALGNDLSFEDIFVQQLRNMLEEEDVVIAISASGNSPNVVKAVAYAKASGAITIGFLGFKTGGKLGKIVDHSIIVDSNNYGPVEDVHLILNHMIAAWLAKTENVHSRKNANKAVPFKYL